VPRRRTFASAIHGFVSLRAALTGEAGSRSTGDPSLAAPGVGRRVGRLG